MFCGKCGKRIREGNLFCTSCGERVDDEVDETHSFDDSDARALK